MCVCVCAGFCVGRRSRRGSVSSVWGPESPLTPPLSFFLSVLRTTEGGAVRRAWSGTGNDFCSSSPVWTHLFYNRCNSDLHECGGRRSRTPLLYVLLHTSCCAVMNHFSSSEVCEYLSRDTTTWRLSADSIPTLKIILGRVFCCSVFWIHAATRCRHLKSFFFFKNIFIHFQFHNKDR